MKKTARLLNIASQLIKDYPKAGATVDGLTVRSDIPNQSSIQSSFNDYEILPGIREIPMSEFGGPKSVFYSTDDFQKSKELAEKIKESGEINPLIIAIDQEGPYILEGGHRYVALYYLNKKSLPALVVIDQDEQVKTASDNIQQLISKAHEEYRNKLFGGNCGMFAYGLAKYLNDTGTPAKIGIIIDDNELEESDLAYSEYDLYHAFVDIGSKYYDGTGQINKSYLINFANEEYGDNSPIMWDDLPINENTRKIISFNTNWNIEWTDFYNFFKSLSKIASIENQRLTLDQARFTKDSLDKINDYVGTTNIEAISKKDDPQKYEKYYQLLEMVPGKKTTFRSPSFITGPSRQYVIGGKTILIWRDAQVDDDIIVAPKGFLKTLEKSPANQIDYIASSFISETDLEELANQRRKKFDDFYKKHNLSPDQEPKDVAIMIPGTAAKYSIISPSAKTKGKWQLTYFDQHGPWGDQTHNTLDEALKQTSIQNLDKAEVMKGQESRLQVASIALMHMGLRLASEWHELPKSDDLDDLLWALYELEFKYSKMKSKPGDWQGNPQRYENTLSKIGQRLISIIEDIANKLLPVYKDWLSSHAITKPKQWAKVRYEKAKEFDTFSEIYNDIEDMFNQYGSGDFYKEVDKVTRENLDHLPKLQSFLDDFAQDERDRLIEEEEEYDEEDFKNMMDALDDPGTTWESIMDAWDAWDVDSFIKNLMTEPLADELYPLWYEKIAFPAWYGYWKSQGIDATRKRVEDRYKELKQLSSGSISDPQKAAGLINMAIQESHQTGKMMEYISEHHDVTYGILNDLSNANTNEWEKDLDNMGLKAASVKPKIEL